MSGINNYIQTHLKEKKETEHTVINILGNRNTLKCEIKSNNEIDLTKPNTIGSLLGFNRKQLKANVKYGSDFSVNIFKVNSINVECNLVSNSYNNDEQKHILHVFYTTVLPGTKIVENPLNEISIYQSTQTILVILRLKLQIKTVIWLISVMK